jgi:osmotically-inducible protein OsmY
MGHKTETYGCRENTARAKASQAPSPIRIVFVSAEQPQKPSNLTKEVVMLRILSHCCFILVFGSLAWADVAAAQPDELVKENIVEALTLDARVDASDITVEVNNGEVILRGTAPSYLAATSASDIALETRGAISVKNRIAVIYQPPFTPPTDAELRNIIVSKLSASPDISILDTKIEVKAGVVTLRGTVGAYWEKIHAEDLVSSEAGVVDVNNHLAIVPTEDFIDEEIAEDIVKSMESRSAVFAEDIDVTVENGHVTLNGVVATWEAKKAAYRAALFTLGVIDIENNILVAPETT